MIILIDTYLWDGLKPTDNTEDTEDTKMAET